MSRCKNALNDINNIELYNYYLERLINIALAQFEWHGLPETCDRLYLEQVALYRGSVAFYIPKGTDFWLSTGYMPYSGSGNIAASAARDYVDLSYDNNRESYMRYFEAPGNFDVYGYPVNIMGYGFNGQQSIPEPGMWQIFYDNMTKMPLFPKLRVYAYLMYEIHSTMRNNTIQQNSPYIILSDKENEFSWKNIFQKVFKFFPVINLGKNVDLEEEVKVLNMHVDFKGNELMDLLRETWREALAMLGISSQSTKRERLITGEIMMDRQADLISLNARLLNRVEFCNKMNAKYGLDLSVNLSSNDVDFDTIFGPGFGREMSTNQFESEPGYKGVED